MKLRQGSLTLLAALFAGCASTSVQAPERVRFAAEPIQAPIVEPALPARVDIEFVAATVGAAKIDGTRWDGYDQVEGLALDATLLVVTNGPAAVAGYLGTVANEVFEGPDPAGYSRLLCVDANPNLRLALATPDSNQEDTFRPTFPARPAYFGVLLREDTRIVVTLWDEDLMYDDPIAEVSIGYDQIVAALESGQIYSVPVAAQSHNQLLLVDVVVRASERSDLAVRGWLF